MSGTRRSVPRLPPSLWAATAPSGPCTPPLAGSHRADVAIVGGGYTGLSAALHLAELGATVCVLDAGEPGWGASGRNGGQVIPGLKYDPDTLERMFPGRAGEELVALVASTPEVVFGLIDRHGIDCDASRSGWIQPAHTAAALRTVLQRAEQWRRRGVQVELLDAHACAQRLGTGAYVGAWRDPRGGAIQPLAFCRGLARTALQAGAAIHGATEVTGLERNGTQWEIRCTGGALLAARQVLLCTNGYTGDLWPGLRQTVIAANSFQVATAPLTGDLGAGILPNGEVVSDARRLLSYFRKDRDGRLILGGRGPMREPRNARDFAHLRETVYRLFPQLRGQAFEYQWSGRVAMTADFLPRVHAPAPGLTIALGYNGRGIGMATTLGRVLAQHMNGATTPETLPFYRAGVTPIPLHALRRLYLGAAIAYYRLRDHLG